MATTETERVPRGVLLVASLSTLLVNALTSSVGVLLPAMSRDTGSSIEFLQWAISGYSLASAAVIVTVGVMADMFGRRRIFLYGLLLYAAASVMIAIGASGELVVIGRCIQGFGAAAIMSAGMGIISVAGSGSARLAAVGIWSAAAAIGGAIGPLIGGLFSETIGWQGMFWVIAGVALVTAAITPKFVPESKAESANQHLDIPGTVLLAITLSTLTLALSQGGAWGWTSGATLTSIIVGLISGWLFIETERRVKSPLLDLSLLHNKVLVVASIAIFISAGVVNAIAYITSIYMQNPFTFNYNSLQAGLVTLPATVSMVLAAALLARLTAKLGIRNVLVVGFALATLACGTLAFIKPSWGVWSFIYVYAVLGIGIGMSNGPAASIATSSVDESQAGAASGISNMARYLAAAVFIAASTTIFTNASEKSLDSELASLKFSESQMTQLENQVLASGQQAVEAVQQAVPENTAQATQGLENALPVGLSRVAFFFTIVSAIGALMSFGAGRRKPMRRDGLHSPAGAAGIAHTVPEVKP